MALAELLAEPTLDEKQSRLRAAFFEVSGYGASDLLSLNFTTKTFMVRNGGTYQLQESGWKRLSGPPLLVEDRL